MNDTPYRPIDSYGGEIRLLRIEPAEYLDDPIICKLECVHLSSNPRFEALSYVWGSKGSGTSIILDGIEHDVFENVEAALRRVRRRREPQTMWIDAICINQQDIEERQLQVLLMRQIYGQAEQVCAWLGELTDGTLAGLKYMNGSVLEHSLKWYAHNIQRQVGISSLSGLSRIIDSGMIHNSEQLFETILGEIRELLARPWWTRAWIMQEAILAKKIVFMCGGETADWASFQTSFDTRMRSKGTLEVFGVILNPGSHIVENSYQLLTKLRDTWSSRPSGMNIYGLLYDLRHLHCTDPRDRIFAFINLDSAMAELKIMPNYRASAASVYTNFARAMLERSKSLEILNCRREWVGIEEPPRPAFAFSMVDQGKYHDIEAEIQDGPKGKLRKGWVKLPPGWERVRTDDLQFHYYNHYTGETQDISPLNGKAPSPSEQLVLQRVCPKGWHKTWDNVGRAKVSFETSVEKPKVDLLKDQLRALPSWVPSWATKTHLDPSPLLDWSESLPRYCAAGETTSNVHFSNNSPVIEGVLFDEIKHIAEPWHPESAVPAISRLGIQVLESWEQLALNQIDKCPYADSGGRAEALWRTHVVDCVGTEAAPPEWGRYVRCWYDKVGWAEEMATIHKTFASNLFQSTAEGWKVGVVERRLLSYYSKLSKEDGIKSFFTRTAESLYVSKRYGEVIRRINRACAHRALFVTKKGYMGLAPWNAATGDKVCVLDGGRTPFLLRFRPDAGSYALVGESFVQGIMGGEALREGEALATRQSFILV